MKYLPLAFVALFLTILPAKAQHSIGVGANYWRVIDDIEIDEVGQNGFSYLFAYRYSDGMLGIQAEMEVFPDDYVGASKNVYAPQAMLTFGNSIFVGAGIGIQTSEGDFADDPYYFFRAGLSIIKIGPAHLDLYANYIFTDYNALESSDIDTDTLTLGGMIRLEL